MTEIFIPRFSDNPPLEGYSRCCGNTDDPRLMTKDHVKFMLSSMVHNCSIDDGVDHHNYWLKDKLIGPALGDAEGMVSVWSKGDVETEDFYDEATRQAVRKMYWEFMFQIGRKKNAN